MQIYMYVDKTGWTNEWRVRLLFWEVGKSEPRGFQSNPGHVEPKTYIEFHSLYILNNITHMMSKSDTFRTSF